MNTKIRGVESKLPDISSLVTTATLNNRISEVENKIPYHGRYITAQNLIS